ncbi:lipocalin family protein [Pelagicoccus mobilis]|uniref:Lipocalin family protein n=1 Tax=Pelagicoccus mobilis TaxID=415221 RepID=A0A934S5E8_9BACT|nr:lipocalin family protein [Pelagicoccus mobilis]MBK1880092.1 lipocalin family protein [Pelagicoccus mobilis]
MKPIIAALTTAALLVLLLQTACSTDNVPNQPLAKQIDIERFMGTWYVHGHSPTFMDKQAYSATETYELSDNGKIQTTYRFRNGGLDGKYKTYRPVGRIHDTENNAEWRMKFFGFINAPYYILYVDSNYQTSVVGHPGKEMAWIMSRSPEIDEELYIRLKAELESRDYELSNFRRIPHS